MLLLSDHRSLVVVPSLLVNQRAMSPVWEAEDSSWGRFAAGGKLLWLVEAPMLLAEEWEDAILP